MIVAVGRVKRVQTRPVEYTDKTTGEVNKFVETRVALGSEEDLNATWCRLGREFGDAPAEGELLAAEAWIRTYASSQSRTGAGYELTLVRRVGLAEVMPIGQADPDAPARLAAVN